MSMQRVGTVYANLINRFLERMRPGYPYNYSDREIGWLVEDTKMWEITQFARGLENEREKPA